MSRYLDLLFICKEKRVSVSEGCTKEKEIKVGKLKKIRRSVCTIHLPVYVVVPTHRPTLNIIAKKYVPKWRRDK